MIVLGGGAVACFALGYLGLHYMGGESLEDTQNPKNIMEPTHNEKQEAETNVEQTITNNLNKIKDDVKEEISKTAEKIESGWGQFWKGAYEETSNDPEPSDYN